MKLAQKVILSPEKEEKTRTFENFILEAFSLCYEGAKDRGDILARGATADKHAAKN